MEKKSQLKTIAVMVLIMIFSVLIAYALVNTVLRSPVNEFVDDDGSLDLQASCQPSSFDGTTNWNITNATLYHNINGSWSANKTIVAPQFANVTYYFNFTNVVNASPEGTFTWNVQCGEANATGSGTSQSFGNNRTIVVRYADPSIIVTPADGTYDLDGTSIAIKCEASPSVGWNLTNISLVTLRAGGWAINNTVTFDKIDTGSYIANFTVNVSADATDLVFSCLADQILNLSNGTNGFPVLESYFSSPNRTVNVEFPPTVNLWNPASGNWEASASSTLNFSVVSTYSNASNLFTCQLLTNETGTWNVKRTVSATNNTNKTIDYQIENGLSDVRWGVYCQENADSNVANYSVNRTIRVDRTFPVVSLTQLNQTTAVNFSFFKTQNLVINYSVTDLYRSACNLYINNSATINSSSLALNNFTFAPGADGRFVARIGCNDSAGNFANASSDVWFNLDTDFPSITLFGNRSVSGSSDRRLFNFSTDEEVNATIYYGQGIDVTSSVVNSSFHTGVWNISIAGFEEYTVYYWNITACDRAGNCNTSGIVNSQFSFTFPWKLLSGWSYYGVWDGRINFSRILNETDAEFVYWYNQTTQSWVSATAGGTTNMEFEVGTNVGNNGNRHVIAIYESVNSTWNRNVSFTGNQYYTYNITAGNNLIKMPFNYTFGNWSSSLYNESYNHDNSSSQVSGIGFGINTFNVGTNFSYNMSDFWFAAYNNSAVTWTLSYVYNGSIDNSTALPIPSKHEVAWLFAVRNVTWNGTNIIGNWSR